MNFKNWKEAEKRASELREQIAELAKKITADDTEARKEDIDVEKREQIINGIKTDSEKRDSLQAELNDALEQKEKLLNAENRQFGLLDTVSTPNVSVRNNNQDTNIIETREYELAWAKYVRSGGTDTAEVRELLNTQNKESAGILVPHTLVNKIEDALKNAGKIIQLCSLDSIKGITTYPIVKSKTNPAVHKETPPAGETEINKKKRKAIKFTSVSIEPQFIAEIIETTRKFEADSIEAFWDWLRAELPDALKRVIEEKIFYGAADGSDGIRGILTNPNTDVVFVKTLANHVLNFNTQNQAVSELADGMENNVTIVMNKKTFLNNVMGLKGTDGHPIYKILSDQNGKPSYTMGGYPVEFTENLKAYDEAAPGDPYMVIGNFKGMKLNFPLGCSPNLIRDEITRKDENVIEYLSEIYVGGNIVRLGSFVEVTK